MQTMYSFRDRVSGISSFPFPGSDKPAAVIRAVKAAVLAGGNEPWQLYPEDHELYAVGTFCPDTGRVEAIDPRFIVNLTDVVKE